MVKSEKKRPVGVAIIAVLYFLVAALTAAVGVLMMLGSSLIVPFMSVYTPALAGKMVAGVFIAGGLFSLVGAVVALFVGLGLWRLRNWARITALVFAVLGAISSFMNLPIGLTWLVVHGLIIWYLGFNKKVIARFK